MRRCERARGILERALEAVEGQAPQDSSGRTRAWTMRRAFDEIVLDRAVAAALLRGDDASGGAFPPATDLLAERDT